MSNRVMKESGIEWIGEIPNDWKIGRVKDGFVRKNSKAQQENPTVLSLARSGVKVRDISKNEGQLAESYSNYNPVEIGDLLLNPMDLYSGDNCNISKVRGVISPAYINLKSKTGYDANYFNYYFKCQYWGMTFFAHGKGVSFEYRWTLNNETLKNYYIPIPSLYEQQAIANYLDEQVGKIDELIVEQKQAIENWKVYKQSLITEKVTKGLNPSVEMKESGIKWIGKIPNDWNLARVKDVSYCLDAKRVPISAEMRTTGNIPYWGAGNIVDYIDRYIFNEELVLLGEDGAPFMDKDRPVAFYINSPIWANNHIHVLRNKENIKAKYLTYSLNCVDYYPFIGGSIIPKLTQSSMKEIKLPLPSLQQQQAIVDYLDEKCLKIDQMIEQKQVLINQLEEYKQSLIYECVTGKRCVL